ncbi:MAG: LPS assembly protein LptD [Gammaproteobacteria bacterium]|nr:LPS assembly protein LptD [Gammaproteobacteria bacterium]
MNIISNKKWTVLLVLLALANTLSMSVIGSENDANHNQSVWGSDFFLSHCPGTSDKKVNAVEQNFKTDIVSDDFEIQESGDVTFVGNVILQQDDIKLTSNKAELSRKNNAFSAEGNVHYQDQQIRLTATAMDLNFSKQSGEVKQTKFQMTNGNMRGEAKSISLKAKQPLTITDVGLTSCPPDNVSWLLQSSNIMIDPELGWGEAEDVVLMVQDIPVFYLPLISFPVDDRRKTGLLYPSVGNSSRNGLELEIPWYWNIAADKDATFSVKYLSKRGLMLGAEYRQLTKNTETRLFTEYLPNDDKALQGGEDRYFYRLDTQYSQGDHWRGNLDLNSVSDYYYFYDFGSNFSSGNISFVRRFGEIKYDDEHLSFMSIFSDDKLLSTPENPYSRLPQLRLSLLYPELAAGISTNLHMEATAFRHDSAVEAERFMAIPEFSMPLQWQSGYIKPQLKLNYSHYSQDDPTNNLPDSVSRTVPIFSIDSAMFFDRLVKFDKQSFIQSLEPRLFYLYVPKKEQNEIALFDTTSFDNGVDSLFRDNRYSGYDRIGDSNQISLALTSSFYNPQSGREQLSVTMGRAYYLEDREVNLAIYSTGMPVVDLGVDKRANSALITNLQLALSDRWWLKGELEYDESKSITEKGALGLQYRSSGLLVNLRHRLNRYNGSDDIEQAEVSFSWSVSNKLAFIGRWQQDVRNNRTIDSFAGLEYESCCWAMRLVARRYLNIRLDQLGVPDPGFDEFNNGIYLEFILKGLTNVGKGLDLERDIQGYDDRLSN